jgi:transposase
VYSKQFKAKLVQQALLVDGDSMAELARRANVPPSTLWTWVARGNSVTKPPKSPERPRRPEDRRPEEKLRIVLAAHGLRDEELGAFLRREGVHEADLEAWRQALHEAALASLGGPGGEAAKERADTKRIKQLSPRFGAKTRRSRRPLRY